MGYKKTENKERLLKLVKERKIVLQHEATKELNININYSAESLEKEGRIKRQKVKMRGANGNLNDVWLLYINGTDQNDILNYEKELINKPFISPLTIPENHCCYIKKNKNNANNKENNNTMTNMQLTVVYNDIIPIYDSNNERLVNARELYNFLKVKTKYADWIKDRLLKYQFVENEDYIHVSEKKETSTGATILKEYYLKMDTAKEIAMVENNEQGRYIRKYFIQIEKEYKEQNKLTPSSSIDILESIVNTFKEQDNKINLQNDKIIELEERINKYEKLEKILKVINE